MNTLAEKILLASSSRLLATKKKEGKNMKCVGAKEECPEQPNVIHHMST